MPGFAWRREKSLVMARARKYPEELLRERHPETPDPPFPHTWVDAIQGGVLRLDDGLEPCVHDRVEHHHRLEAAVV